MQISTIGFMKNEHRRGQGDYRHSRRREGGATVPVSWQQEGYLFRTA